MEAIATIRPSSETAPDATQRPGGFEDLGSEDFLKLMITQLVNQDPLGVESPPVGDTDSRSTRRYKAGRLRRMHRRPDR